MLAAIILAGGESRRMGQPKALLKFRGKTFLEHLLEITRHPRIGLQRVVVGAAEKEILAQVPLPADVAVNNPKWELGQLSSITAGLRALPSPTEGAMICPVDHALVTADLIAALIRVFDARKQMITLPVYSGKRGHPVIFHRLLYDELLVAPTDMDLGARIVVRAHSREITEVPTNEEGVVLNLNDPLALEQALKKFES